MQGVLQVIYPYQCPGCRVLVQDHLHLCPECWREAHFISGCICPKCGVQMLGDHNDAHILCDDCLNTPRPWNRGRAVFLYNAKARSMILALKRKDWHDLVAPFPLDVASGVEIFPPAPLLIRFLCIGNDSGADGLINQHSLRRRWRGWQELTAV